MSREFGQRTVRQFGSPSGQQFGRPAREGMRNVQGIHFERTDDGDDESGSGSSKLRKMVFWIAAAALLVGIYVGTRGSGQNLSSFWKKNGGQVVDDLYVPPGAKDVHLDQANKTCKARGEATAGGPVGKAIVYVTCLAAADNPRRLCQVAHRTHFIAAMRSYYRMQAQARETSIKTDPRVAEALKTIIVNGHIPRRDIIAAGPSDLETALRGAEVRKGGGC